MCELRLSIPLSEYIEALSNNVLNVYNNNSTNSIQVVDVSNDSRKVSTGFLFVAINGEYSDGHKYIKSALDRGASALIVENYSDELRQLEIPVIHVVNSYYAYASISELRFSYPSKDLKLIGVTGTNGKTSSAYLIRHILKNLGKNVGLISTVNYSYGDVDVPADRTTPMPYELQKMFYEMVEAGCEYVVMEASSHALHQNRFGGAQFDAALFTNISGDHLDYHKTMENYYAAKKLLFKEKLKSNGFAVINVDDYYGNKLYNEIFILKYTYGLGNTDYKPLFPNANSSELVALMFDSKKFPFTTNLTGIYNCMNVLGAIAIAHGLGFDLSEILSSFDKPVFIPGRLERVHSSDGVEYYVDYAHSDDALKRVLEALRAKNPKKLVVVFGCGGDRDKTKRARMGKVASQLADKIYITSDNPRTEKPDAILDDIEKGIEKKVDYQKEKDRKIAIKMAVILTEPGSIVLVAGKGHEQYQEINGVKYHFDDRELLREFISQKENRI